MDVKIRNKGNGYWVLMIDSPNDQLHNRVLASITSYCSNQHYCITDFRYSTAQQPSLYGDCYSRFDSLEACDKLKQNFDKVFLEPKSFYQNGNLTLEQINGTEFYTWQTCDGIVFAGADRPFEQQNLVLKNNKHIFSYKAAKQYLSEAKNFWEYFSGTFEESKIENIYRLPSSFEIKRRLGLV